MTESENKTYEISFLLQGEEDFSVVTRKLSAYKAELLGEVALNKIKLAYPIKKFEEAYFGYLQFKLVPEDVVRLGEALKLEPKVLRFLIVSVAHKTYKKVAPREQVELKPRLEEKPVERIPPAEISNEALEKKLEEILG